MAQPRRSRRGRSPEYEALESERKLKRPQQPQQPQQSVMQSQQSFSLPSSHPQGEERHREASVLSYISGLSTQTAANLPIPVTDAKTRLQRYTPSSRENDHMVIPALMACLHYLPELGATAVARDIINCINEEGNDDDESLFGVFDHLYSALFIPMRSMSQKATVLSSPISKRQEQADKVGERLSPPSRSSSIRGTCLKRDDNRCVVTGRLDRDRWKKLQQRTGFSPADLHVAHIIPYSYGLYKDGNSPDKDAETIWSCLYICFPEVQGKINATNINDLSNSITIASYIHSEFGDFSIAFDATGRSNEYRLKTYNDFSPDFLSFLPKDRIVRFRAAPGAENIRLPDPVFLEVHFRLAEIYHTSGMGDTIDNVLREFESTTCFAEDGSTNISQLLAVGLLGIV